MYNVDQVYHDAMLRKLRLKLNMMKAADEPFYRIYAADKRVYIDGGGSRLTSVWSKAHHARASFRRSVSIGRIRAEDGPFYLVPVTLQPQFNTGELQLQCTIELEELPYEK